MKTILIGVLSSACLALLPGCGNKATTATPTIDMAKMPMVGPPDLGCYANPQTSNELLNSCPPSGVSVDKIDKHPTLPLLNADGTRPPLP
jgi:hypothetical protein